MIFLSNLLLLVLAASTTNNAVATSSAFDEQQPDGIVNVKREPAAQTSLRGPNAIGRDLKNTKSDVFVHECNKYDDNSDARKLCKLILASNKGNGKKSGAENQIVKTIDEMNDPLLVVAVIEAAGLSLSDPLLRGKYANGIFATCLLVCPKSTHANTICTPFNFSFLHAPKAIKI